MTPDFVKLTSLESGGELYIRRDMVAADSVEEKVGMAIERKMNNLSALTNKDLMR